MRGTHRSFFRGALALGLVAAPAAAHAGGLFIPGLGPVAQGRAGAYVATAEDPSAIGVNPAGLAKTDGVTVLIGANLIDYAVTFTRRGTYDAVDNVDLPWAGQPYASVSDESRPSIGVGPFQAVPMVVVAVDLEAQVPGLHVAAGLIAPSAYPVRSLGADYQIDDPAVPPPPGRYDVVEQDATVIMPSIAVGYRVNDRLDVGARFTWGIADIQATTFVWGTENFEEWTGHDARFTVEAQDRFVPGFGLGALYRLGDGIELGLSWDSPMAVRAQGLGDSTTPSGVLIGGEPVELSPPLPGRERCAPGGQVGAFKTCVALDLPMVTTVGGRRIFRDAAGAPAADVELNVAWERWSAASDYRILVDAGALNGTIPLQEGVIRHGLRDVVSIRLGGSVRLPLADVAVRAGVAHDTAAARDGWERLDLDGAARTTMALGLSIPAGPTTIHVGAGYVHEGTRDVGTDCNPSIGNEGCRGTNMDAPLHQRGGPDPVQPLVAGLPTESPFNAGRYRSRYLLAHLAVVARF
jgi:long-chain fatty acid transport protein